MFPIALAATLMVSPTLRTDEQWWGTREGLPQSSVTAVAQGPHGLLYLGTFGGLARFDARRFDLRGPTPWTSIRVTALVIADDGTQWVGLQDGGVARVDPDGSETQLPTPPGLEGSAVWDIALLDADVWVATAAGVAHWDGEWTPVADSVDTAALWTDGETAWLGGPRGLKRCDDTGCRPVDIAPLRDVADLAGSAGTLVAGGAQGAARLASGQVEVLTREPVGHVALGSDGEIWFSHDSDVWQHGTPGELHTPSAVRALFVDRESSLWVGTDSDGLGRVVQRDWSLLETRGGALPLLQRRDGSVWAGPACGAGGLISLDHDAERVHMDGCVRALVEDRRGDVWIGSDEMLSRWSDADGLVDLVDVGHRILALLPTNDGLWIATDSGGAFVFHDPWLEPVDVGQTRVLALAKGVDGEVWLGTHGGLVRYDRDGLVRHWTREDGAPAGAIRALHVDGDGTVLMGSYGGGLGILRNGTLSNLTADGGLRDNVVSAIVDDGRGALWLNGNRGTMRLTRAELEAWLDDPSQRVQPRQWSTPEGNGGGQPAGIATSDGRVLFPTVAGVVTLRPETIIRNSVVPEVVVLGADVDGAPLQPGTITSLPPGPGRVHIEFTAGTLRRPDLALLAYRRVQPDMGDNDGWMSVGDDRRAVWGALPPGLHTVELRVANEDGLWSVPVRLQFELAAAWYQRTIVWGGLAGVLALLGLAVHQIRTRAVKRRNAALTKEVAQRQEAEAALRVSESHYRNVFEGTSDALFVVGRSGAIEQANPAAEALIGGPVVGRPLDALVGEGSEGDGVRPVVRADDARVWAEWVQLPFEDGRTLARAADVTNRVEAEAERRTMSVRLAEAERTEAVGRLAGGIAHDFNNLFTAIGGTAELLDSGIHDRPDRDAPLLTGLRSCVERGSKLTRQLLAFARRQHLDPRPIDPAQLIKGLETILRPTLRDDVRLDIDLPPGTRLGVLADATHLELSVVSLVLNAQDAMPRGGRITMRVRQRTDDEARSDCPGLPSRSGATGDWVQVEVVDDGEGIEPADLARVLEPFFTTRDGGSGLGLPSVKGFAEQSGGALQLRSQVGRGTRAQIWLPRVRPPSVQIAAVRDRPPSSSGRIVVCDDDDMVREMVVAMLRHGGYDTIAYADPQTLLHDFSANFECDLVVLDVLMPGLTGPELAKRLLQRRPTLPVVFISGYTRDQVGDDLPGPLLPKPFQVQALLDLVSNTLALARPTASA